MGSILSLYIYVMMSTASMLFDFNETTSGSSWKIVDDVVMGGRSQGSFAMSDEGYGVFSGEVSLENNGGFSSVRRRFDDVNCTTFQRFTVRVKGDGSKYQFRVKSDQSDYHSYIYIFKTTGEWQTVEIPFDEMYPAFRGRTLNIPNYPGEKAGEIAFLIGNKKAQDFKLLIDYIELR